MFDDEDWVFTPGAYITYPAYSFKNTERREAVAFQSDQPYKRRTAADERRVAHGMVGWNSSLKAPYRPLGTPRFDIARRPASPGDEARIQIRHPSRSRKANQGDQSSMVHIALETAKEERGKVSHSSYRYYMIYVPPQRVLTISLVSISGDPDMYVCNTSQFPSAKECTWKSSAVGEDRIVISPDDARARPGTYYIAVYGADGGRDSKFSICATVRPQQRALFAIDDGPLDGFARIRDELRRARMRTLAAKRGVWLEWEEEARAREAAAEADAARTAAAAAAAPAADAAAAGGGERSARGAARGACAGAGSDGNGTDGAPAARAPAIGRAPSWRARTPARLPVPSAADLSAAAERAPIGQAERRMRRSLSATLRRAPRLASAGASAGTLGGARGAVGTASFAHLPRPGAIVGSATGAGEVRKLTPARFYTRQLTSSGVPLRSASPVRGSGAAAADGGGGGGGGVGAANDAAGSAARAPAGADGNGGGGSGDDDDASDSRADELPLEHRVAKHRSDYARLKRVYNAKLLEGLRAMERERAFNHRVRSNALAHLEAGASGLQLAPMMEMLRADAYAIKVELERIERERAREERQGRVWAEVMGGGSAHAARSALGAVTTLKAALPVMAHVRRKSVRAGGGGEGGA